MKHTPGPWRIEDKDTFPYIEADQGKKWNNPTICHLYQDVTPFDSVTCGAWLKAFDNATANARLIAAAPDLLNALERIVKELGASGYKGDTEEPSCIHTARAVIAKARGETE